MGARSLAKLLLMPPGPPELSAAQIRAWPAGGALPWELAEAPSRAGPGRPATSTPWTGKVARDSRSVAADAGEQEPVSACPASSAADWPEPGRPVAPRSPEGMRQPPNTRLPGSAARASESGECGARRGMGVPGRDFFGLLWSLVLSKLPGRNFPPLCVAYLALVHQEQKSTLMQKPSCIGLGCWAGGQGAGTPSSITLRCAGALFFQTP